MNAIIFSALSGVVMMFSGIFTKNKRAIQLLAIAALLVLVLVNIFETYGIWSIKVNTKDMLVFSKFGLYFNTLAFAATAVYVILSGNDMQKAGKDVSDYLALIFFVLSGVSILSGFNNLLMMFLGIEILSIPLYILTGSEKRNLKSNEAALKYFLMGSFSTGLLLMGIALMYGATGSFAIDTYEAFSLGYKTPTPILEIAGLIFVFVSLLFKVSAAPFHFWTPDVYDGAPSVFTSFMATVVKAAGFIAFIRLFNGKAVEIGYLWKMLIVTAIILTLLVGNITAVFQQSVKRMLAYSSIAQAGFMLFALYAQNDLSTEGILLYAVVYTLATVGIFGILIKMEDYTFEGYNGLAKTQPLLAATNTIFLLSLAGIPLTGGFFAKYFMLAAVVKTGSSIAIWLVILAVLFAAVSVYYYFRVIQAMYFKEPAQGVTAPQVSGGFKVTLVAIAAILIVLGVYPDLLLQFFYF